MSEGKKERTTNTNVLYQGAARQAAETERMPVLLVLTDQEDGRR